MPAADYKAEPESDPRFPSGKWAGYYLMPHTGAAKHPTECVINFASGRMSGDGRDKVGEFTIDGRYDLTDGKCVWLKKYSGKHDVFYQGYNEGQGIWGVWTIPQGSGAALKGGFHIWPENFGAGSEDVLHEEADVPVEGDPVLMPV